MVISPRSGIPNSLNFQLDYVTSHHDGQRLCVFVTHGFLQGWETIDRDGPRPALLGFGFTIKANRRKQRTTFFSLLPSKKVFRGV